MAPSSSSSSAASPEICSPPGSSRCSSATSSLAACGRVLMLDKRGTGLSDRVREVQSLETTMDDVRAVMDAVGSERAVLWTAATSTGIGVLFAATYPERCAGLVLFDPRVKDSLARLSVGPDRGGVARARLVGVRTGWGERSYLESLAREWAPEVAEDDGFRDWFVWHMRRSLSPGAALTSFRTAMELDVRDVPSMPCAYRRSSSRGALPGPGHYTAERIRGAERVELPELDGVYTWVDDERTARRWRRRSASSPASRGASALSGCWRRSSSRTSSARRSWRRGSATRPGGRCSSGTTRSSDESSHGSRAASSTPPEDGFFATFEDCPSGACGRRDPRFVAGGSSSRSGPGSTPANAKSRTARSPASRSRSGLVSLVARRSRRGARLEHGQGSRRGPGSSSRTAAHISSRYSREWRLFALVR